MSRYIKFLQISEEYAEKMEKSPLSQDYTLLCKLKSFSRNVEQMLAMQMKTLNQEVMTVIRYPPFTHA